ncbi:centrosomal protein of 44 kDa isoform X3 [Rhinatrema bivittatum]|uniref:centrosomal protein of 44 kDa isoform X3 n=1 Tax=Rhinatrema bivittatum TaxID=194408 RepID=UPI001129E8C9|nr:centrosomal protein of 44 kDa isoform X3 [Rhinatrema bivittatum]
MATGDVKGCLRKLEQGLRLLNYPRDVDYTGLVKGDPAASLPIINYAFSSYSNYIAEILVDSVAGFTAKSDLRFIEAIYKVLRDQFQYKPILTKQQFLQFGFAERKIQLVCDIIKFVMKKHKELSTLDKAKSQPKKKTSSSKDDLETKCEPFFTEPIQVQALLHTKKPLVERHLGSEIAVQLLHDAASPSADEDREQSVASHDNFEAKCELMNDLSSDFNSMSEERTSSRTMNPVSLDIETKEALPESLHHQSSGYSSLLSTDASPKAMTINYSGLTDISKETTRQRMERLNKMIEETSDLLKYASRSPSLFI